MSLAEKLFGSFSDRELKKINPITKKVLALETKYQPMSDAELQAQTPALKERLENGETLDDILPDAFAVCREAAWRVLGMKHFPVQIMGGIALHRGSIAEMQTGEGKTLVATLPAYLNALTGEGVHIVTVNDYLAKRDSEWMGKLYRWLGLNVGLIVQGIDGDARRRAYNADITYGTNNEYGFDYLRDNMVTYKDNMVQRGHAFAIVDEVDSILIDEARTPLIISGKGEDSSSLYTQVDRFVRTLHKSVVVELEDKVEADEQTDGDYVVDEKHKTCTLTAKGIQKAEEYFKVENLAAAENMTLAHHIDQAIKAYGVMQKDIDYVVKNGEVIIVDEFTGRLMIGRRYNEGLHQAIEAKDGVKKGAYVLVDTEGTPDVIIMATGSEVQWAVSAAKTLAGEGIKARVVSVPCVEWFEEQDAEYKEAVLPAAVKARVSVEAGVAMPWYKYLGSYGKPVSIEQFGLQGDGAQNMIDLGITAEHVVEAAKASIAEVEAAK